MERLKANGRDWLMVLPFLAVFLVAMLYAGLLFVMEKLGVKI